MKNSNLQKNDIFPLWRETLLVQSLLHLCTGSIKLNMQKEMSVENFFYCEHRKLFIACIEKYLKCFFEWEKQA
jgi:hypothetical protein